MSKDIDIGKLHLELVFRYKWDRSKNLISNRLFKKYSLGIWYENTTIVGRKDFQNPKNWGANLVNCHRLGIDLLIFKFWVTIDYNGKHMNLD